MWKVVCAVSAFCYKGQRITLFIFSDCYIFRLFQTIIYEYIKTTMKYQIHKSNITHFQHEWNEGAETYLQQILSVKSFSSVRSFAKIKIKKKKYKSVKWGWVSFLNRLYMDFGYVWECVHFSLVFNKINTCTWHHSFFMAVEQIYNCNYSPPGWFSSTPCAMQDIPLHYFYYLSNLLLNSCGDGASITSITSLPVLNALSDMIPSCPTVNSLDCVMCSFRLYFLVWSLSHS